jgi:hypothetical protein
MRWSGRAGGEVRIKLHKAALQGTRFRLERAATDRVQGRPHPEQLAKPFLTIIWRHRTKPPSWCPTRSIAPFWRAKTKAERRAPFLRPSFRHDRRLRAAQLQTAPRSRLRLDLRIDLIWLHAFPFHRRTDLPRAGQPAPVHGQSVARRARRAPPAGGRRLRGWHARLGAGASPKYGRDLFLLERAGKLGLGSAYSPVSPG